MAKPVYKPFHDTYKIITFTMSIGMIYPNQATEKLRLAFIPILLASATPLATMIFLDMYKCWIVGDIVNIIRHSTVIGPFLGGFFKMLLMFYKRNQVKEILEEFNRDYASYNNFNEEYRAMASAGIKNSLIYSEMGWAITVVICVMTFPIMAIVLNIYSFTFKFDSTKYMVHDLNKPFSDPEERFESPYFEIMFFYTIYCAIMYVINFTGYDGFFGLSINHACMKMGLIFKSLEDALKAEDRHIKIVEVIKEQCRLFRFVELIQETFNIWLGLIFIATMIQICTCMYHIAEGYGFDLRYMIFVTGAIIHIYLPCHYAAKLKAMSVETATIVYCSGWEHIDDQDVRKILLLMIARAQNPIEITAFNTMAFDMELFMSIMQTSYSMYTLLRS